MCHFMGEGTGQEGRVAHGPLLVNKAHGATICEYGPCKFPVVQGVYAHMYVYQVCGANSVSHPHCHITHVHPNYSCV